MTYDTGSQTNIAHITLNMILATDRQHHEADSSSEDDGGEDCNPKRKIGPDDMARVRQYLGWFLVVTIHSYFCFSLLIWWLV